MTRTTPAIEVRNLTKYYGDFLAVDNISFQVEPGEVFGFLGPNGAGKSTTQRILSTLLEPTGGTVRIHGHDLARSSLDAKRLMGLVPEESNVYGELTCRQNLVFAARLYRVPSGERESRIESVIRMFELTGKRHVRADELSKGLRRRLSLGMALVHAPRLLFLDEPTSGLDAWSTRLIHAQIRDLRESGTTIFLTTHQIEHANQLCDRVAVIDGGRIAAIDTPENLRAAFRRMQKVRVSMTPDDPSNAASLRAMDGVTRVVSEKGGWSLYTESPDSVVRGFVHFAEDQGARITDLHILGPDLEEVFLEITRREQDGGARGKGRQGTQEEEGSP